jgi:hypothetical protein
VTNASSRNPVSEELRRLFEEQKLFEGVVAGLNDSLNLPQVVDIQLVDCGTVNAFFDPTQSRIIVCYELVGYLIKVFKPIAKSDEELATAALGATFFAFFHELGHALAAVLKLPIVGKEEDAVDQMATLVLMGQGDEGTKAVLAGAQWFLLKSQGADVSSLPFWDEHSLDQQRFYNIACLVFGADPAKFDGLVRGGLLPEERAKRCPMEYSKISSAWDTLLKPHFKSGAAGLAGAAAPAAAPAMPTKLPGGAPGGPAPSDPRGAPTAGAPGLPSGGAGCESAAAHVIELMATKLAAELAALPAEQAAAQKKRMSLSLPLYEEEIAERCRATPWTEAQIQCVLGAATTADGERCL